MKGFTLGFGLMILLSCAHAVPEIDIKSWEGDSKNGGITRAQEATTKKCSDPEFNEYICMTGEDLKKIYDILSRCREW